MTQHAAKDTLEPPLQSRLVSRQAGMLCTCAALCCSNCCCCRNAAGVFTAGGTFTTGTPFKGTLNARNQMTVTVEGSKCECASIQTAPSTACTRAGACARTPVHTAANRSAGHHSLDHLVSRPLSDNLLCVPPRAVPCWLQAS